MPLLSVSSNTLNCVSNSPFSLSLSSIPSIAPLSTSIASILLQLEAKCYRSITNVLNLINFATLGMAHNLRSVAAFHAIPGRDSIASHGRRLSV